tara:strand:- start:40 stop:246 length:207 start_codon:yes stop_codon:yes gene_type:complete
MIKWYREKKLYWYNMPLISDIGKKALTNIFSKLTKNQLLNTSFKGVKSYPKIDSEGRKVLFVEEIKSK